jgi:hypothetical protein
MMQILSRPFGSDHRFDNLFVERKYGVKTVLRV